MVEADLQRLGQPDGGADRASRTTSTSPQEADPGDLGHLVHGLVDEGKAVAAAAGIELHDDPWEMNVLATQRGSAHYPSMLEDVDAHRQTEIELITGSLVREADAARRPRAAPSIALRARQRKGSIVAGNPGTHRRAEMMKLRRATLALVAVAVVAVAVVGGGSASSQQAKTLTIGWAYDGVGNMAPFDGPALATAKSHIATINKAGGTKVKLLTCNTQGNKPAIAKACAGSCSRRAPT